MRARQDNWFMAPVAFGAMTCSEPVDPTDRDRILAAAWDVLGRTSYENLKVQAVIRIAGVSTGSFYRHFGGKQDLVAELLLAELRRATSLLEELTNSGPPEARVRAWIDGVVSLAYGRHAGPRARWFTSLPQDVMALIADRPRECRSATPLEAAIADGVATGAFPDADPHRDALMVECLCSGLDRGPVDWLATDRAAGVQHVADFVLAALTGARGATAHAPVSPQSTPEATSLAIPSSS
jgi:AcrR family transcriptional regulator